MSKNNDNLFSEEETNQFCNELFDSIRDKSIWELRWYKCKIFLEGVIPISSNTRNAQAQYLNDLDPTISINAANDGGRIAANLLLQHYRHTVSKLAIEYPSLSVLPASDSYDDAEKAQVSELALQYYWNQDKLKKKLSDLIKLLVEAGNAGLHTYYDTATKKICTDVITPFDLFFEPNVRDVEESQWSAIRRLSTKEELLRLFPDKKAEIDQIAAGIGTEDRNSSSQLAERGQQSLKNRINVYFFYHKDGRYGILLQDTKKWLWEGQLPENVTPIQLVKYTDIPGNLWGLGLIEPIADVQLSYNKHLNYIDENAELNGNPIWLVPDTSNVRPGALNNKPGNIIRFNIAGGAPVMMTPGEIPQYRMIHIQELKQLVNDIGGINQTSMGKQQSGVTAATAIQALQQADVSQLQLTQDNIEFAVQELARTTLVLMKQFYDETQFIRMFDDAGPPVYRELQATDLVEIPEISLEAGSLFTDNTLTRQNRTIQMLGMGLIDKEEAIAQLNFKTRNKFMNEKIKSVSRAKKMLEIVKTGQFALGNFKLRDDLDTFERVFREFLNSDEFYTLAPEIQDRIDATYDAIVATLAQKNAMTSSQLPGKDVLEKLAGKQESTGASPLVATTTPTSAQPGSVGQAPSAPAGGQQVSG